MTRNSKNRKQSQGAHIRIEMARLQKISGYTAVALGGTNGVLTTSFFYHGIGPMFTGLLARGDGLILTLVISALLAIGFTLGEFILHISIAQTKKMALGVGAILFVLAAINVGASLDRANVEEVNLTNKAKQQAKGDPRWASTVTREKQASRLLDDGLLESDDRSSALMDSVEVTRKALVQEYVEQIGQTRSRGYYVGFGAVFILVNIMFGICVAFWYSGEIPFVKNRKPKKSGNLDQVNSGRSNQKKQNLARLAELLKANANSTNAELAELLGCSEASIRNYKKQLRGAK